MRGFENVLKIPELRKKIFYTFLLLAVYRIGGHIPVPGIDGDALSRAFAQGGGLMGMYDLFVGGALARASVFALGIMPYISASIIIQLLTSVFPYFERLKKEGEAGRQKMTEITRYGTVVLALIQGLGISQYLIGLNSQGMMIVPHPGIGFTIQTVVTLITGTIFVMWLGERITERGIGNGISLIIFAGIVGRLPGAMVSLYQDVFVLQQTGFITAIFLGVFMFAVVAFVVLMTESQRKIPVTYAKQVRGRKVYGGQSTHIPLRLNTAGVIPVIFAQAFMMFPSSIAMFFPNSGIDTWVNTHLAPGGAIYITIYSLLIILFAYVYTAITFNPQDLAENMKKYGGFIPGRKPGKSTAKYIEKVLVRVTLPGSIFLAAVAVLPMLMTRYVNVNFMFGGTSLLIVVGVGLETLRQIETHLMMRHYDGFLSKGKIRGRR
ncbi:MAG: preprotein translocase subunit SecY [Candidatus Fermentibacteraceae bacterium]|nr:preprotein translocase subunit SecY [Candidatus Fermentibacteraceae bacterium]MBN2609781.1 preprotein translocase subunit SecY [Candidatus Fermentibacteraceae bacterium]